MLSLSDNEFSVLNFLVRNFAEKLTIRNVAQRLNFSPAGVFNILKKLERQNLAAIVLLYSDEKFENVNVEKIKQAKTAIFDKKTLLLITDNIAVLDVAIPNVNVIVKTEDEAIGLLRKKDSQILQILKKGVVLFGEDKVVEIIKNCISRF